MTERHAPRQLDALGYFADHTDELWKIASDGSKKDFWPQIKDVVLAMFRNGKLTEAQVIALREWEYWDSVFLPKRPWTLRLVMSCRAMCRRIMKSTLPHGLTPEMERIVIREFHTECSFERERLQVFLPLREKQKILARILKQYLAHHRDDIFEYFCITLNLRQTSGDV